MKTNRWIVTTVLAGLLLAGGVWAGSLNPTNAPGPTMNTLAELYQKLTNTLAETQAANQKLVTATQQVAYLQQQVVVLQQQVFSNQQALAHVQQEQAPAGMVLIPAGVNMGTDPDFGAYSLTNVTVFPMDKYEVTKAQWDAVRTWGVSNGYTGLVAGAGKAASHPVQTVSWYECVKWCNARSEKEGREAAYYTDGAYLSVFRTGTVSGVSAPYVKASANGYRLPTEAQWAYAARGGVANRRFPWSDSDTIQHSRANYYANTNGYAYDTSLTLGYHPGYTNAPTPYTSPGGAFAPNGYGLYDMAGNVWEWCFDWYTEGADRVIRGGSWFSNANMSRAAIRSNGSPGTSYEAVGFRTVLPPGH